MIDDCLNKDAAARPDCVALLQSAAFGASQKQVLRVVAAHRQSSCIASVRVGTKAPGGLRSTSDSTSSLGSVFGGPSPLPETSGNKSRFVTKETRMFTFGAGSSPQINAYFLPQSEVAPVKVSAGEAHVAVVTVEKKLYTWNVAAMGDADGHSYGQLGHGNRSSVRNPKAVEGVEDLNIVDVSCGQDFTVALDATGQLHSWGCNEFGCLGTGENDGDVDSPGPVGVFDGAGFGIPGSIPLGREVVQVSCGMNHVLALASDGTVFAWGNGEMGKLGLGDEEDRFSPERIHFGLTPEALSPEIVAVAAGSTGSLFLTVGGRVYGAGNNEVNQLGLNRTGSLLEFRRLAKKSASLGANVLEEGIVDGEINAVSTPWPAYALRTAASGRFFTNIAIGETHSAAIDASGKLYMFGDNSHGQLATGNAKPIFGAHRVRHNLDHEEVAHVACGDGFTVVVTVSGGLFAWGRAEHRTLGFEHSKTSKVSLPRRIEFEFHNDLIGDICCSASRTLLIAEKIVSSQDMDHVDIEYESQLESSHNSSKSNKSNKSDKSDLPAVAEGAFSDGTDSDDDLDNMPWLQAELAGAEHIPAHDEPLEHFESSDDDMPPWLVAELAEAPVYRNSVNSEDGVVVSRPESRASLDKFGLVMVTPPGSHSTDSTTLPSDTLESPRPCTPQAETRTERIALLTKANYDLRTLLEIQQNAILRMREELRMMQEGWELPFSNKGELEPCIPTAAERAARIALLEHANNDLRTLLVHQTEALKTLRAQNAEVAKQALVIDSLTAADKQKFPSASAMPVPHQVNDYNEDASSMSADTEDRASSLGQHRRETHNLCVPQVDSPWLDGGDDGNTAEIAEDFDKDVHGQHYDSVSELKVPHPVNRFDAEALQETDRTTTLGEYVSTDAPVHLNTSTSSEPPAASPSPSTSPTKKKKRKNKRKKKKQAAAATAEANTK